MSGVFNAPIYGHSDWGSLFSPRQALSLTTFAQFVREAGKKISQECDTDFAIAIETCLAQALDRLADFNSSLCVLNSVGGRGVVHTFGRQALPMVWDFMETNPFNDIGANWIAGINACVSTIQSEYGKDSSGQIEIASATRHPLPDDSAQVFLTDPPYYNAVPYADLSDFFYVWLKRTVGYRYPDLFRNILTPKDEECCEMVGWDPNRYSHKDGKWFEEQMKKAMSEGRRILTPNGVGIVVFAHKSTAGWEVMLQSMVDAGWIITGSWPIDTERPGRLRAQGSAALASSIHLVCRPRENPDGSLITNNIGDWRDVLAELPKRIHDWMPRLAEEGVVGADAIFACLGPALEIYSRYSSVEKASGEKVELKEYLEQVWAAVSREALNMIFEGADASGFEEDARLTAMWLWTLRTAANGNNKAGNDAPAKSLPGYSIEYDAARKIAQGLGAHLENLSHLVEIKGNTAMLLSAGARTRYLFGKDAGEAPKDRKKKKTKQLTFDFEGELKEMQEDSSDWAGDLSARAGSTVLDQLHQSMILFGAGRGEALKRFLVEDGVGLNPLYWRLAQALSALYPSGTDEKRWVDGVLARKKGLGF
jgi:putative DNA methylase